MLSGGIENIGHWPWSSRSFRPFWLTKRHSTSLLYTDLGRDATRPKRALVLHWTQRTSFIQVNAFKNGVCNSKTNFFVLNVLKTIPNFLQKNLTRIPLPWASGLPVAIQWQSSVPGTYTLVYTGMALEKCQCASCGLPVAFQWSSSVFQLYKLTLDRHWDTSGC